MTWLALFNVVTVTAAVLTALGRLPLDWFEAALRGLHNTIGITTPTERQMRWVLVVWLISMLVIVDAMAMLLAYVF